MILNEKLFTNKLIESFEEHSNRIGVDSKADAIVECFNHFYPNMEWVDKINRDGIKYLISNSKSDKALIENLYDILYKDEKQLKEGKSKKLKEGLDKDKSNKKLKESKSLKEGTSNFGYLKHFPLLVFLMSDEIEDDDVDNKVCVLSDWELEDLKDRLDDFNRETQIIADRYYDKGNEDDYYALKDIEVKVESGYYSGAWIDVDGEEELDALSEENRKEQFIRFENLFKELKDDYGLTHLNRDGVFSNGEAIYSVVKEGLKKGIEKYLDIELEDGEGPYGGISFQGETLRDFVEECDIDPKEWSLKDINDALKDCGIKPIQPAIKEEWYGIDVDKEKAEKLKKFLRQSKIYFEPSENGNLTHFEIDIDKEDVKDMIDKHLNESVEDDEEEDYIAQANEFIDKINNSMSEEEAKDWYYREYRFDTHKPEDEVEQKIADALKKKGKIVERLIKEGYFDYMDKDYADVLDSNVDVYDLKQFVIDESEGQYRTHYADKYAIIVCPNGKGCIVDHEAVGQDFDSVDSEVEFGIEENKDKEYTDENGTKHRTINLMSTHKMITTPKEILEKASHTTMKYRDFFDKYNYNDRCAYNFKDLVEYIKKNGGLQEGCHSKKKKGKKLKEGYIGQTLSDFFFDCIDPDLIEKITLWGEDDIVFEGDYEDAMEEYADNEFIEFDCGEDKVVINVDTSEEYQVTDYFVDVQDFLECFNGDEIEVFDINEGKTLFSGDKYDLPDDVAEKIFVSFDAPKFISINIEEDDDFDETLKEDKEDYTHVVYLHPGYGYRLYPFYVKCDSKEPGEAVERALCQAIDNDYTDFYYDVNNLEDTFDEQEIEDIYDGNSPYVYFDLSEYGDYPNVVANMTEVKIYKKDEDPYKDNYKEDLCESNLIKEGADGNTILAKIGEYKRQGLEKEEIIDKVSKELGVEKGSVSQFFNDIKEERKMSDGPLKTNYQKDYKEDYDIKKSIKDKNKIASMFDWYGGKIHFGSKSVVVFKEDENSIKEFEKGCKEKGIKVDTIHLTPDFIEYRVEI